MLAPISSLLRGMVARLGIAVSAIGSPIAASAAEFLPLNGLFYGVSAPMDSNAQQQYYYRRPTGYRFEAEMTASIVAVKWDNRFNHRNEPDSKNNYSKSTGGTILLEIRKDTGLQHPPFSTGAHKMDPLGGGDPNLLGKTATKSLPKTLGGIATVRFLKPIPVIGGQRFWLVFNQLHRTHWVSVNAAQVKAPLPKGMDGPGGPYWGDGVRVAYAKGDDWLYQAGTQRRESRHLAKVQFLYRLPSGKEIWSGFGSIYAHPNTGPKGGRRAFNDSTPVRMRFTPKRSTFFTRRLHLRAYIHTSDPKPSDMKVEFWRGRTLLGSWQVPAREVPVSRITDEQSTSKPPTFAPIPFTVIDLGREIEVRQGAEHFLRLGCASGHYNINAQQVGKKWNNRNSFTDGWAEYSTNRGFAWRGWHVSNKNNRRDLVLPFMFEVSR